MPKGILPWQMGRLLSSYRHLSSAPFRTLNGAQIPPPVQLQALSILQSVSSPQGRALPILRAKHLTVLGSATSSIIFPNTVPLPCSSTTRFSPLRHSLLSQGAYSRRNPYLQLQKRCYSDKGSKSPSEPTQQTKSVKDQDGNDHRAHGSSRVNAGEHTGRDNDQTAGIDSESIASSVSKYLHDHLPRIPHRPAKEELLAAATNFRQRLKVRFKWMSIRSMRPWNIDEWGAFVSWFMIGHLVWILVGTTTFFSLVILSINTVFAQGQFRKSALFLRCTKVFFFRNPCSMDRRLLDSIRRDKRRL